MKKSTLLFSLVALFLLFSCTAKKETAKKTATSDAETDYSEYKVHYKTWKESIRIENSKIYQSVEDMEFDNPVSSTPSSQKTKILKDGKELRDDQLKALEIGIEQSGFWNLTEAAYGAGKDDRHYPYSIEVNIGGKKKKVLYRSHPDKPAPEEFKTLESFIKNFIKGI